MPPAETVIQKRRQIKQEMIATLHHMFLYTPVEVDQGQVGTFKTLMYSPQYSHYQSKSFKSMHALLSSLVRAFTVWAL